MEDKISDDIGERVIAMLEELNEILRKIKNGEKNEKECTSSHRCNN